MKKIIITAIVILGLALAWIAPQIGAPEVRNNSSSDPITLNSNKKKRVKKRREPIIEVFDFVMPNANDLEESVQKIVENNDGDLSKRIDFVHQLKNKNLAEADFKALMTFLKRNPFKEGPQLHWHSLKNEILVFMIEDGRYKESQAKILTDIVNDKEQHEVMREYTLQYIPDYFEKQWKGRSKLSEIDKSIMNGMIDMLWKVQENSEGPIPGTALIGLHDLSDHFEQIDKQKVIETTQKMILNPSTPEASRMAALSIASERKLNMIYKEAAQIGFDDSESVSLRMSAIHTASTLDPEEEFWEKLRNLSVTTKDTRLKRQAGILLTKHKKSVEN